MMEPLPGTETELRERALLRLVISDIRHRGGLGRAGGASGTWQGGWAGIRGEERANGLQCPRPPHQDAPAPLRRPQGCPRFHGDGPPLPALPPFYKVHGRCLAAGKGLGRAVNRARRPSKAAPAGPEAGAAGV